nr:hypothetical protein [Vibrio splendidus]
MMVKQEVIKVVISSGNGVFMPCNTCITSIPMTMVSWTNVLALSDAGQVLLSTLACATPTLIAMLAATNVIFLNMKTSQLRA